jgi:hypothetical protein
MDRVDIILTLNLPRELADRAISTGLLTDARIERWLVEAFERQTKLDWLAALQSPLTEEEKAAEVEAHHREKRSQRRGPQASSKQQ